MKSFTGHYSSVRGWALLLALLLGAGMMISACGEEEVPAPTTPVTPPPPPPPPGPTTPTGLRATVGDGYIEWTWDAVANAAVYEGQFSEDATFTDADQTFLIAAPQTSHRVQKQTSGYFRVRAGAGTPLEYSDWSDAVRGGPETAGGPAIPTGLRASAGDGYIEWTWNAVAGVAGYQGQFSEDATFTDTDQIFLIAAPQTSHRVHNRTSGYFRVRSALADLQFSDWSDAVRGTTDPPAAAVPEPLSVPGNVQAGNQRNTAITVTWDAVDDAEAYEVQQQADGATSWSSASCGGTGNRVVATECVASGLDQGTAYGFRVRAVPDSADSTLAASAWSSAATATTTGRAAVTVNGGLNLRWRSEGEDQAAAEPQINWTWDPVDDRALQPLIDHYVALLLPSNTNDDCPNLSATPLSAAPTDATPNQWFDLDSDISFTLTITNQDEETGLNGEVRGLCVVRTWEDERKIRQFGEVSVVWGSTPPRSSDATDRPNGNPEKRDNLSTSVTTSIGWEFQRDAGFEYVLRLLTTSADTGQATTDPADCPGGAIVESPDAVGRQNVDIFHTERNPDPYTIYQLCARAENDYGASEWTFVGTDSAGGGSATSRPTAPSAPVLQRGQSSIVEDNRRLQTVNSLFWSVRHKTGTPKDSNKHDVAVFLSAENTAPRSDEIQTRCNAARGLSAGTGLTILLNAADEKFDTSANFSRYNGNSAFDLEYGPIANTPLLDATNEFDEYYFYMCIRADDTPSNVADGNHGPWTISRTTGFVHGALLTPAIQNFGNIDTARSTPGTTAVFHADWDNAPGVNGSYSIRDSLREQNDISSCPSRCRRNQCQYHQHYEQRVHPYTSDTFGRDCLFRNGCSVRPHCPWHSNGWRLADYSERQSELVGLSFVEPAGVLR